MLLWYAAKTMNDMLLGMKEWMVTLFLYMLN